MTGLNKSSERWTTCQQCGKRAYVDRKTARRARKHHPDPQRVAAYRCPHRPDLFHLGHKPRSLIAGEIRRDDLEHHDRTQPA